MGDMTLPYILRSKITIIALFALFIVGIAPGVSAQSAQPTSTASDLYSTSGQSSFQDAGGGDYQQNAGSSDLTAGGSANILNQVTNGQITVSGAPAFSTPANAANSSVKLWLAIIFFASGIGLLVVYIYTKRNAQNITQAEQELIAEITAETKPKAKKAATAKQSATNKSEKVTKPSKKTKTKSKKKKHHR